MKKVVILFIVIFCIQILAADTITQTYNFEIPEFISIDGYTELIYQNCHNFGEEGYPYLPYLAANILLPQNQELSNVRIISSEYYPVQDGITVKPAERQFPLSSGKHLDYKVIPNKGIYNSTASFPGKIIDNTSTHFLCGHSIASFTICPVSYVPSEKQVEFLKSITVEIKTGTSGKALAAERFLQNSLKIEKRIHNIVENPEMLNRYSYSHQSRDDEEDILLITNSTLLPSFSDYIDFKEETGFIVATVTTEYINTNYTGADLQEKIRNCIIDHYTNNGIGYVILGGDSSPVTPSDNIIPHRGFFADPGSGYDDDDIPADMYYACLDGNWNNDGDNRWGEPGEDDLYAEVGIGRICVDSSTEIANQINKLEKYQDSPVVGDLENALWLGELLWDDPTWGGDYKDEVSDGSSAHGYTTVGLSGNFTVTKLYERDGSWDKYDVFSQYNNNGVNLRNHLGHSNVNYNMLMYTSDLNTSNFTNNGTTRGYAIGYSQGCYNGSFDNRTTGGSYSGTNCFAEQITTMQTADVAEIGNSRYGWGMHSSTNGASQYFDRQFFDAVFGENITAIGDANGDSKEDNVSYINGDQVIRWCAYELNLFGDPSMDIWTDAPVAMNVSYPPSIPIGTSSIDFTTDAPYARIGLKQNGIMIGRAVAGASGDVTVILFSPISDTNDLSVSIIGHNKIRHQGTIVVVSDQAYVIYNSHIINDPAGNNNGEADFGEAITLDMTLENVGNLEALSVNATLSSADSFVNITDNSQSYGTISHASTSTQNDAFAFYIADNIPDQHIISFNLEVTGTSARDIWNSSFQITVNAPELTIDNMIIDDSNENNNGRLDPGETVDLIIPTNNEGHSNSPSAIGTLSCVSGYITVNNGTHNFGVINSSSTENAVFNITVDSEAPIGTNVSFDYEVDAGNYDENETFNRTIGLILEDFETGNFSSFDWTFAGSADWSVVTEAPYEGTYCTRSGAISSNQTSELILTANVTADGTISFYRKVSSESSYDYLQFFIDGSLQAQWSGNVSWIEVSYPVTAGNRTFKWQYYKDGSASTGSDCAWIDYIIFPSLDIPEPADITVNPGSFSKVLETNMSTSDNLVIGNMGETTLDYTATISYSSRSTNHISSTYSINSNIIKESEVRNELETKISQSLHGSQNPEQNHLHDRGYVTIGAGGSVSGTYDTNITPFGTYYHDGRNQYLFTSSELSVAGLIAGDITTVGWNIASAAGQIMNGFNLELKHTTATSVTGFETGFTNCYSGTWTASAGWNDISFSTPFNWNGSSNLLVKICFDNTSYTSNSTCYYDTYPAMNGYAYNDNTSGCSDPYEGNSDSRPQIRFTGSILNWLTLNGTNSVNGAIPGGSPDDVIVVGFDSTDLTDGVYTADIVITSNDPDEPEVTIPVTLHVIGTIGIPQNVIIEVIDSDIQISWDEVTGANSYIIYASDNPYGTFEDVSESGFFNSTSWSSTITENKKFYYVVASSEMRDFLPITSKRLNVTSKKSGKNYEKSNTSDKSVIKPVEESIKKPINKKAKIEWKK